MAGGDGLDMVFIGYGFDTYDLYDCEYRPVLRELMEHYDPDKYNQILELCDSETEGMFTEEELEEYIFGDIEDIITQYICDIINDNETDYCGDEPLFVANDPFVIFEPFGFKETPRAKYISNEEDLIKLLTKYLPIEELKFGKIFIKRATLLDIEIVEI